jgi:hypothetical protein
MPTMTTEVTGFKNTDKKLIELGEKASGYKYMIENLTELLGKTACSFWRLAGKKYPAIELNESWEYNAPSQMFRKKDC